MTKLQIYWLTHFLVFVVVHVDLFHARSFRSRHRLPVLCWRAPDPVSQPVNQSNQSTNNSTQNSSTTSSNNQSNTPASSGSSNPSSTRQSSIQSLNQSTSLLKDQPVTQSINISISRTIDSGLGPVLMRSSQPMVGLRNNRNEWDELLLQSSNQSNYKSIHQSSKLIIVDCRPSANARANQALGAGTEIPENYIGQPNNQSNNQSNNQLAGQSINQVHIEYCNIENIHAIRKSYKALHLLLMKNREQTLHQSNNQTINQSINQFWTNLMNTLHLYHLSTLIAATSYVVDAISRQKTSTLIHCSDGWDRTSQLTGLSLLCLDSSFRSLAGFQILIEKEFCSFGHKFRDRVGYGMNRIKAEESPIFAQFLDCVDQIRCQNENQFEFNDQFLIDLLDCLIDGRFGNFLCNSELEKVRGGVTTRTGSVWGYLLLNRDKYVNPRYSKYDGVIDVDVTQLRFHTSYYERFNYEKQSWKYYQYENECNQSNKERNIVPVVQSLGPANRYGIHQSINQSIDEMINQSDDEILIVGAVVQSMVTQVVNQFNEQRIQELEQMLQQMNV